MSEDVFRIVITIGVGLACLSTVVQAVIVYRLYVASQSTQAKVHALLEKSHPILDSSRKLLEEARPKLNQITDHAVEIAAIAHQQSQKLDQLLNDVRQRAEIQIERYDVMLEDTAGRIHDAANAVQSTVLRPVQEVNAVVAGIRTALQVWLRGQRPTVENVTQDEEMFI